MLEMLSMSILETQWSLTNLVLMHIGGRRKIAFLS